MEENHEEKSNHRCSHCCTDLCLYCLNYKIVNPVDYTEVWYRPVMVYAYMWRRNRRSRLWCEQWSMHYIGHKITFRSKMVYEWCCRWNKKTNLVHVTGRKMYFFFASIWYNACNRKRNAMSVLHSLFAEMILHLLFLFCWSLPGNLWIYNGPEVFRLI